MRWGAALAALALAISISPPAHAQPGRTGTRIVEAPPATRTKHYTGSIIAADGIAAGIALVGLVLVLQGFDELDSSESSGGDGTVETGFMLMLASPLVYAIVPPLVHLQRGNAWGAGKSLALRLALPLAGAAIGTLDDISSVWALAGLGAIAAMVTDWAVLAKVEVARRPTPYAAPVTGGGATLGIMGAF